METFNYTTLYYTKNFKLIVKNSLYWDVYTVDLFFRTLSERPEKIQLSPIIVYVSCCSLNFILF